MGAAAIPLAVFAAAFQARGAYNAGVAGQNAANYQAAVARNNAAIAEQNAKYAEEKGTVEEGNQRQLTAQVVGEQRAHFAAGNIEAGSGSALRLQKDAAQIGEVDAQTIRNNAAREAYAWRVKGMNQSAEAELDQYAGQEAMRAGKLGFWSSIVGGASSTADKWDRYKSRPAPVG